MQGLFTYKRTYDRQGSLLDRLVRKKMTFVFCKTLAGQCFADVTLCHSKPLSGHASFSSFGFASSGCHQQQNGRFLLHTILQTYQSTFSECLFTAAVSHKHFLSGHCNGVRDMECLRHTSESDLVQMVQVHMSNMAKLFPLEFT